MPWALLSWLLGFVLQSGLLGVVFFTLIQLYDFEEDLLNNVDCAKRCNRFVYAEAAMQAMVVIISLASGHPVAFVLNLAGCALITERFLKGKQLLDPLELWTQLAQARKRAYYKLIAYGVTFAYTLFRLVELVVHEVLSDHGRHLLKLTRAAMWWHQQWGRL